MDATQPSCAMVLAAGYGKRMRPLTDAMPKPLVSLAGRPLLDHVLDRLVVAGIARAIVNVHYLPEQIEDHLARRALPQILISDERAQILDTGGAVQKALPLLGAAPFFVHNSDSVWIERNGSTLRQMMDAWNSETMDAMLLLAPAATSLGYSGRGDYALDGEGRPHRRRNGQNVPFVFTGVSINHPRLFHNSDSVWIERNGSTLRQMMDAWNSETMDAMLLLAPAATSLGYSGRGDYALDGEGRPHRRRNGQNVPFVFTGVSINHPRLFHNVPDGAFSILKLWDEAESAQRLAAIQLDGEWMHVGTPEALAEAGERLNGQGD